MVAVLRGLVLQGVEWATRPDILERGVSKKSKPAPLTAKFAAPETGNIDDCQEDRAGFEGS